MKREVHSNDIRRWRNFDKIFFFFSFFLFFFGWLVTAFHPYHFISFVLFSYVAWRCVKSSLTVVRVAIVHQSLVWYDWVCRWRKERKKTVLIYFKSHVNEWHLMCTHRMNSIAATMQKPTKRDEKKRFDTTDDITQNAHAIGEWRNEKFSQTIKKCECNHSIVTTSDKKIQFPSTQCHNENRINSSSKVTTS